MSTAPIKVLVIEDDPGHAALIRRSFEDAGTDYRLQIVGTLAEGLAAIASEKPDVVLVDLVLPDGRGTAVLSLTNQADIPVIVLTAHGTQKDARDALKEGAADYIVKSPDVFEETPRIVTRVLQERLAQRQLAEAQNALKRNEALLRAITESAPLAFLAADLQSQKVLYVTRRFAEIWSLQSVQEKLLAHRIPLNEVRILCESRLSFERKVPGGNGEQGAGEYVSPKNYEYLLNDQRPEVEFELGNGKIVRQLAVPIVDSEGQRIGHLFLFEDITAGGPSGAGDEGPRASQSALAARERSAGTGCGRTPEQDDRREPCDQRENGRKAPSQRAEKTAAPLGRFPRPPVSVCQPGSGSDVAFRGAVAPASPASAAPGAARVLSDGGRAVRHRGPPFITAAHAACSLPEQPERSAGREEGAHRAFRWPLDAVAALSRLSLPGRAGEPR